MTATAYIPTSPTGSLRKWLLKALAALGAAATLLYGLAAIDAAVVNYRSTYDPTISEQRLSMQRAAEAGQDLGSPGDIASHSNVLVAMMASVGTPLHAFGKQGLSDSWIHYTTMPRANVVVIAMHSMLAGTAMLFGALQFWPAFRRNYPRWHRGFGLAYMVLVQTAMIAAAIYLLRTPVHLIYDQLTFYVGLWVLDVGVTITLWLSIHALARKRIAQHQAWMALNFGMLLTAPIQRYGWIAFAAVAPEGMRQLEANYAVSGMLIPLSFMIGYGLYTLNRLLQVDQPKALLKRVHASFQPHARLGRLVAMVMLLVLAASMVTTVQPFVFDLGLTSASHSNALIPHSVLQLDQQIMASAPVTRWLFVLGTLTGLLSAMVWLWGTAFRSNGDITSRDIAWAGRALSLGTAMVGLALWQWGLQWGMPSFTAQHGGALHLFGGTMALIFATLLATALARGQENWAKEWSWFAIACLVATPSFYLLLPIMGNVGMPEHYVAAGHAYRLAAYGQWTSLVTAFVVSVYSPATHAKLAR